MDPDLPRKRNTGHSRSGGGSRMEGMAGGRVYGTIGTEYPALERLEARPGEIMGTKICLEPLAGIHYIKVTKQDVTA